MEDPFEYYLGLDFSHSGLFELYARFNGTDAPVFPMQILVYSTQTDPDNSNIIDLDSMGYQICSLTMVFDIELLDSSGDPLTSSDVELDIYLED